MLTTLVLQDTNLNTNPSRRDSALRRVVAAAWFGRGIRHLSETQVLVKGGRTVGAFGGALESHTIFAFLCEG